MGIRTLSQDDRQTLEALCASAGLRALQLEPVDPYDVDGFDSKFRFVSKQSGAGDCAIVARLFDARNRAEEAAYEITYAEQEVEGLIGAPGQELLDLLVQRYAEGERPAAFMSDPAIAESIELLNKIAADLNREFERHIAALEHIAAEKRRAFRLLAATPARTATKRVATHGKTRRKTAPKKGLMSRG